MKNYDTLRKLVEIDSPSGFTTNACTYIHSLLTSYGWQPEYTTKGAVRCALGPNPTLAIAAHTDTLGAIVSGVKTNGTLTFALLGSPLLPSFEGSYVRIHTMEGKVFTGTLLFDNPSAHSNKEASTASRTIANMHIRIDELVNTKEDTQKLGIRTGDCISFDTRYTELPSGYIKSHFMDNKAGCYVLFEIARRLKQQGREAPVELFFSNYEEVGHGGTCGYSPTIKDLLVIDMGVLGDTCDGQETLCSICVKDSSGPYDFHFRKKLVELADQHKIPYALDVYPYYSSDGSAARSAGNDFRVALIGPGVAASHGVERTHSLGIEATIDLCLAYIDDMKAE
ncbi:MAG: M42 family metallopeptidase [Ignavibacteria bacterium]|nr:M42 family metallopeptidase [Ignavibacteria bacterium]